MHSTSLFLGISALLSLAVGAAPQAGPTALAIKRADTEAAEISAVISAEIAEQESQLAQLSLPSSIYDQLTSYANGVASELVTQTDESSILALTASVQSEVASILGTYTQELYNSSSAIASATSSAASVATASIVSSAASVAGSSAVVSAASSAAQSASSSAVVSASSSAAASSGGKVFSTGSLSLMGVIAAALGVAAM